MNRDTSVVSDFRVLERVRVRAELLRLGRARPERIRDVPRALEVDVGGSDRAHVAPGPGERHPRRGRRGIWRRRRSRRGGRRRGIDHRRVGVVARRRRACCVQDRIGPVGRRGGRVSRPVRVEAPIAVGDRHPVPVAVQTRQRRQGVTRRVRDQRRVTVRQQRPVLLDEILQVRHQLQVGRDVGVIAKEMRVVQRDLDDVLNAVAERARRGRIARCRWSGA